MQEWIPSLSSRKKWQKTEDDIKTGNIVIVISPDSEIGKWPLGRILETIPGRDGHVRKAIVLIGGKKIERGINRLITIGA